MRRGFTGLSGMVQTVLEQNPLSGQVFIFRGRRGNLVKLLWHDGDGLCLFQKRLDRGRFVWPQATGGTVSLTRAQLDGGQRRGGEKCRDDTDGRGGGGEKRAGRCSEGWATGGHEHPVHHGAVVLAMTAAAGRQRCFGIGGSGEERKDERGDKDEHQRNDDATARWVRLAG